MDEKSYSLLKDIDLPNIILLDSKNIESTELENIKNFCGREQYRIILKSSLSYFLLKNNYSIEKLMYLNPEMYFYSHPSILFESWMDGCVFTHQFISGTEIKKVSEIFNSGLIGFVRKEGALYFLEDYIRNCISFSSQKLNTRYSNFDMPLADYYGIKSIVNLAADVDISLLRSLKTNIRKDKLFSLKRELICFNFKNSKSLRMLGRIIERNKCTSARNLALKRIYQAYIHSLKKAYEIISSIR